MGISRAFTIFMMIDQDARIFFFSWNQKTVNDILLSFQIMARGHLLFSEKRMLEKKNDEAT